MELPVRWTPAICEWPEHVEDGSLMLYNLSLGESKRRLARGINQIFKGVRPSERPFDSQTKGWRVTNLRTAKAIGLAIPRYVLLRADEVVA